MQVDYQEEDQFVKLQEGFKFFRRSQIGDNFAETQDSNELQCTEDFERSIVATEECFSNRVKRKSGEDVHRELTTEVVSSNHFYISHFSSRPLIDICGSETDNDVYAEESVDDVVEELEQELLEGLRAETYIQWNHENVERGQDHDKKIPLSLPWVVDTQQAGCLSFLMLLRDEVHYTIFSDHTARSATSMPTI